ncbi:hypothetical protein [Arthrobacter sp. efr-133-TYG-120]|uniref:hypothetical protein n=1 Tax=Arthrobacter sp. efr-133-TYG-120 TaxID=3040280 RepID=UPI00254E0197|nr:hypothetical protein [Arthrobacter sp. efr-133-TYG-120]
MDDQTRRAAYAALYADIRVLVAAAPAPAGTPYGSGERANLSGAAAVALSWGWLIRLLRTGEAAMQLEAAGYGEEASPLVRSILEHAMRLYWVAQEGGGVVEVALRQRSESITKMRESQSGAWTYTDEEIAALEALQLQSSKESSSLDTQIHIRNFVDKHPAKLMPVYQAWLLETQRSHPTLSSARPYYTIEDIEAGYILDHEPDEVNHQIGSKVCAAALFGVSSYAEATKTSGHFEEPLGILNGRYVELIQS